MDDKNGRILKLWKNRANFFKFNAVLAKNHQNIIAGTQRLFSVEYLFGEPNIAQNLLLLEDR